MAKKTKPCPKCDGEAVPILHGLQSVEDGERRGELVLGGCVVEEGQATWRCTGYGYDW